MRGRFLPIGEMSEHDLRAWQDLADHAVEPNPLFEPACLVPAARHLTNGQDMRLVVAEEDGKFMGCFPVVRTPARARPSTSWHGTWRPTFSTQVRRAHYNGTPLVREERGEAAFAALLSTLADTRGPDRSGILVLERMNSDGSTARYVRSAANRLDLPLHVASSYERPIVHRRPENSYRANHDRKARQNWERGERQLGERLGGEVELVDRSSDPAAVESLLKMEAAGYKGRTSGQRHEQSRDRGGTGGALVCWPGEPEWFTDMCDHLRSQSRLLVYSLEVGGTLIAMNLMFRGGSGIFGMRCAFDEAYARYGPGSLLQLKTFDQLHDSTDAMWLDSCTYPGNEHFLRLYPDRRRVSTFLVGLGGFVDRACLAVNLPARRALRRLVGPESSVQKNEHAKRLLEWAVAKAYR